MSDLKFFRRPLTLETSKVGAKELRLKPSLTLSQSKCDFLNQLNVTSPRSSHSGFSNKVVSRPKSNDKTKPGVTTA